MENKKITTSNVFYFNNFDFLHPSILSLFLNFRNNMKYKLYMLLLRYYVEYYQKIID